MKIFFTFIVCTSIFTAKAQQEKLNKFHIVDALTSKPVVASVSIVRAKLSITTENDGVFIIPGDLKRMTDTVIFSVQNYDPLKLPLKALSGLDTLRLRKANIRMPGFTSALLKDTVLNNFEDEDVVYFAGLHEKGDNFYYLQLAQLFNSNKTNTRLDAIQLDRLAFNIDARNNITSNSRMQNYVSIEYTKFKIRIYDIDTATGKPGKDLCKEIIDVQIRDSEKALISLKKYNIIIPNKVFFVAVEWMRDYYNAHYTYVMGPKVENRDKFLSYKPAIGISPVVGNKLNIWAMDTGRNWIPYNTFSPFGTDLAIKAILGIPF